MIENRFTPKTPDPWLLRFPLLLLALVAVGCARDGSPPPVKTPPTSADYSPQESSAPMTIDWPFQEAKSAAVITLKRIIDGSQPILYVVHDEDGDWQFLDGGDVEEADAATVSLENILQRDASLRSLADLPTGWAAERDAADQPWKRYQK